MHCFDLRAPCFSSSRYIYFKPRLYTQVTLGRCIAARPRCGVDAVGNFPALDLCLVPGFLTGRTHGAAS